MCQKALYFSVKNRHFTLNILLGIRHFLGSLNALCHRHYFRYSALGTLSTKKKDTSINHHNVHGLVFNKCNTSRRTKRREASIDAPEAE